MNKEEDKQNNVPKVIVDDRNGNNNSQQISLNEVDKNSEEKLLHHVAKSKAIFKSQQKDDPDLTFEEKLIIARNILQKSYCLFLSKFGHYMKKEHLKFFAKNKNEDYEIAYYFNKLQRYFNSSTRQTDVKNRRYQALKTLIKEGEYFSESEMMKRNPLLYKHLIGQYMTEEQKRLRDNIDTKNITFVNLLIENIERDNLKMKQKLQEEEEQNVLEENDTDEEQEIVYASKNYGEKATYWAITPTVENKVQCKNEIIENPYCISKSQKQVLKQEFVTNMYQNFLDGKDIDFDYSTVDENEAYDNIDLRTQDEEDKYFDSESPETTGSIEDTNEIETEDELDIYMKSLKEQVATEKLSLDNLVYDE